MMRTPIKAGDVPIEKRAMLAAGEAASLIFGKSRSTWYSWLRDELIPRPVKLPGGNNYWRRIELLDWVAAGCPQQSAWRWSPARLPTFERLLQERRAELEELGCELSELKDEILHLRRIRAGL